MDIAQQLVYITTVCLNGCHPVSWRPCVHLVIAVDRRPWAHSFLGKRSPITYILCRKKVYYPDTTPALTSTFTHHHPRFSVLDGSDNATQLLGSLIGAPYCCRVDIFCLTPATSSAPHGLTVHGTQGSVKAKH